jgi:hypothetical protein
LLSFHNPVSLAKAINLGVESSEGGYCLLLNPDVELAPDAIEQMQVIAQEDPSCAAVAAKLRFLWAPAFLNGVGNSVGAISWGQDNGLGHLDLGQFDKWGEVPSSCFAATLISKAAWMEIGPTDENFPLYYEDSEWSYRARILGYSIRLAPKAVIYHAFSGRRPGGQEEGLSPKKLHQVVYGRLRFITKILGLRYFLRFVTSYILEDLFRITWAVLRGRFQIVDAIFLGWRDYLENFFEMLQDRNLVQAKRKVGDAEIVRLQNKVPLPLIWHGLPELTSDAVRNVYIPLISSGKVKRLPEIADEDIQQYIISTQNRSDRIFSRSRRILEDEGLQGLINRYLRHLQWVLR